ncbi:MAG TPA: hypothetical protein VHC49_27005 [Mycobacteriales bacterium]|nr:hypothetical protein [Mycobacteriales bacterium]
MRNASSKPLPRIGLAVAVIIAIAGVTGLLAPGFLLGNDQDELAGIADARYLDDPTALIDRFSAAVQDRDSGALKQGMCGGMQPGVADWIGHAMSAHVSRVDRSPQQDGIRVFIQVDFLEGTTTHLAEITRLDGSWCWLIV